MKYLISLMICGIALQLNAQRTYFCDNVTSSGDPIGVNATRKVSSSGTTVKILFQNGSANFTVDKLTLGVEKLDNNDYLPFDVKSVPVEKAKNWVVYDYKFISAGSFKIIFEDASGKELSKEYLTLEEEVGDESWDDVFSDDSMDDPSSTLYFTYSTITACVGLNTFTGEVDTPHTSFTIDQTQGGRIYFKVENPGKPFKNTQFIAYIDRQEEGTETYKTHDTKYFTLNNTNSEWDYFIYDFYKDGKYSITLYTGEYVFIRTIYLDLTYRN